ncbi:beta-lactamase family protein [Lachnospiraceae bacterium MD1]|jgi:CubicO group peptidase (beta-lactamase class C family)|uniref:Beta-lactamase family protein n=1 Tax=Variimorphobacter saccharofermentans TaxID=2755051 RepID=A0A839K200_9FIRM|nr:serine hydrolase domain-containing protein [Variimorphobacter saccharofermentans]MBB2183935.1 beta-lactamase family protein [Variimorphobacter saccharofermentans]
MLRGEETKQIKEAISGSIAENYIAGANLLVIKDGQEVYYHEDGFADKEARSPIKRDTIFRLYSMSKPVTAAAAMILLERGLIDLYEPVSKFLPGFANQKVAEHDALVSADRDVTIKDLLSMTSGLVYPGDDKAGKDTAEVFLEVDQRLLGDNPMSTQEIANKLGGCALAFQPGTSWQYGSSADVLGAVIEVVSGQSFGEFLQKEIFDPLEMKDTGFWVPKDKMNRLVKTYEDDGEGGLRVYLGNNLGINQQMDRKPAFESGGAGLVSTIDDYAKFATMLMNQGSLGGRQILRPKTVEYFTTARLNEAQQKGFDNWLTLCGHSYGNLMRIMTDSRKAGDMGINGEYGWDGWLGAYFANIPSENLTMLFMIQRTNAGTNSLTRKLRNIILSSL